MLFKQAPLPERAYEKGNVFFMAPQNHTAAVLWNLGHVWRISGARTKSFQQIP